MIWSRSNGSVSAVPLGEAFKSLLTGEGLGPERMATSATSQFLLQYAPSAPGGVARPLDLPNTVLAGAFGDMPGAVAAAQLSSDQDAAAPATPTLPPPNNQAIPPPPPPPGGNQGLPPPPPPAVAAAATPTATLPTAAAAVPPPPPAAGAAAGVPAPGAVPGVPAPGAPVPGAPVPGAPAPGAAGAAAPTNADRCYNDEQITFSPADPRVSNEMLVAVTSSRPHPYGRLAGTEKTTFVRERPGQLGYVWEWTIALTWPGRHEYTFYVDSTIPCKTIEITVRQALATRTPTPYAFNGDNGNSNSNNNGNSNSNGNSNDNSNGADLYNCNAFVSQQQAQAVLRADPSDPNRLDTENNQSRDGIACYPGFPYANLATDYTPVPVP